MFSPRVERLLRAAPLPVQRAVLKRRLGQLVLEHVGGIPLVVLPEVFNPAIFRSSDMFVRALRQRTGSEGGAGHRALDMGTGTGVLALVAAQLGYAVVAVDVNSEAVRCARINVLLNHQEHAIEVRVGDLFAAVGRDERFDLVVFNPPYFDGEPRSPLDRAWRSTDVPERFGAGLPAVLAPGGRALVSVSSHGGAQRTRMALSGAGLETADVFVANHRNEDLTVVEARRPGARA